MKTANHSKMSILSSINKAWSKIAPFWPLKNLIAVNPLGGLEDLTFEEALKQAEAYFQQSDLPISMQVVNRESIKWLQVFFDGGQSTIKMPLRQNGLLHSVRRLLPFDKAINFSDIEKRAWFESLPEKNLDIIQACLLRLEVPEKDHVIFLILMLTTLPGWAAHIQYRISWADAEDSNHPHNVTQEDYLALRLMLTCLLWKDAKIILDWYAQGLKKVDVEQQYNQIKVTEEKYAKELLKELSIQKKPEKKDTPDAQFVFCIDVRSEPFRRTLEQEGNYETYGFAGFFGIPIVFKNTMTKESYASCPVLLKPAYTAQAGHSSSHQGYKRLESIKKVYQSLKYTFTTPFVLAEMLGFLSGLWMAMRTFFPNFVHTYKCTSQKLGGLDCSMESISSDIPLDQQCIYGATVLSAMGLTDNFAPIVILCGHGSSTENNAYATALHCGACGGRQGGPNACVLASILNNPSVRQKLKEQGILIPTKTYFLGAEHNTTTDAVKIYDSNVPKELSHTISVLKKDLKSAQEKNSQWRSYGMGINRPGKEAAVHTSLRAKDWAQVRPEWGLARNAAFIVGPRWLTKKIDLEGRCFLHSYDWEKDLNGSSLTLILTAPMVVAHWINSQYLFSTLDNVAYGGGSKITKNITGKIGVMQGNASDLMHGLPLQSVYKSDTEAYHETMRLMTVVYAPHAMLEPIIIGQEILKKLFTNEWVKLVCIEPDTHQTYILRRDLTWERVG
jgi:uncharacterized protein YbcC (UPF0753/DUF2309 family)